MKLNVILMACALLLTAALTLLLSTAPPPQKINVGPVTAPAPYENTGQTTPDVTLSLLDGTTTRLHDYKGRIVILNFWASWCVPCAVEYQQMLRLAAAMPDTLTLIAVSVDEDRAALDRFLAKYGPRPANVIIARDPQRKIMQDVFQTVQLPESYLIDPQLILRDKVIGASIEWDGPETRARLDAYLSVKN